MSAVGKLNSPLKELVAGATQDGSADFGKNEKDKAEVSEWIEKVAAGEVSKPEGLKVGSGPLNHELEALSRKAWTGLGCSARTEDVRREQLLHCCGCSIVWCTAPHSCE